jgi:hypothetical protein
MEFGSFVSQIYEESFYESNDRLLIKKLIFLLLALSMNDEGLQDYAAVRALYTQFREKKKLNGAAIPEDPLQVELLKLALHLV